MSAKLSPSAQQYKNSTGLAFFGGGAQEEIATQPNIFRKHIFTEVGSKNSNSSQMNKTKESTILNGT